MWSNCRRYNVEGSEVDELCSQIQAAFESACTAAGLPLPAAAAAAPKPLPALKSPPATAALKPPSAAINAPKPRQPAAAPTVAQAGSSRGRGREAAGAGQGGSTRAMHAALPQAGRATAAAAPGPGTASSAPDPVPADWQRRVTEVVRAAIKLDVGGVFSMPVDVEAVPDYLSLVTTPMDLGTVYDKLRKRRWVWRV